MLSILFQKNFFLVASYSVMKYFDINLFWYIILNFFGVPHTHTHTHKTHHFLHVIALFYFGFNKIMFKSEIKIVS